MTPEYLSGSEVARQLGVTGSLVSHAFRRGTLQAAAFMVIKGDKRLPLFAQAEVDRYATARPEKKPRKRVRVKVGKKLLRKRRENPDGIHYTQKDGSLMSYEFCSCPPGLRADIKCPIDYHRRLARQAIKREKEGLVLL